MHGDVGDTDAAQHEKANQQGRHPGNRPRIMLVEQLVQHRLDQVGEQSRRGRVEQAALGREIIVDQGGIHARLARHFADGDAVEAMFGKQILSCVQNQVARVGKASLRCLARASPSRRRGAGIGRSFGSGPGHDGKA